MGILYQEGIYAQDFPALALDHQLAYGHSNLPLRSSQLSGGPY
jgi:hypothetical protein